MINKYQALINELRSRESGEAVNKNSRVLVVDGFNTFIRSYAASPVTNGDGIHVGGISGFLLSIGYAIKSINPTRLIIVFDGKDGSSSRRALFPDYKQNRKVKIRLNRAEDVEKEDNQLFQLIRLMDYLQALPLTTITIERAEADDVIAYITKEYFEPKKSQVYIMSSDKDFMQLVNQQVHIWSPTKKQLFFTEDVQESFNVPPSNFALFRALTGDDSDNIPGVKGLGVKTLLAKFPEFCTKSMDVDSFLQYTRSLKERDSAKIYQTVLDAEEDIRLYYKITQLSESNLNLSSKLRIIETLDNPINRLAKLKFFTMLTEDKMTNTIKNPDLWLRETTTSLDQLALQG